ncbi:hypothetical protein Nepgr_031914 [Nepenthes gracilis]|uniref:Uncharacterized protein n=1 Tax=Nepenthes gracilis TaxID=150966 RepID=A0AAD3TJ12_NEPGR|nr:hypothetical protein Nepgr_031914 [Nepenthes gracilis]
MASSSAIPSSAFLPPRDPTTHRRYKHRSRSSSSGGPSNWRSSSFRVRAAKLPYGVELPKVQPKFNPPSLGFTKTAEIWNSRACMIGLIGTFIIEFILKKGILQVIGVDVGKGLNLPL